MTSKQVFYELIPNTSALLTSANVWTNSNYYTNVDIRFSGLVSSGDTSFLRYNDTTGQISKSLISSLSILGLPNSWTSANYFSHPDIRFSGIASSSDTSFLRYNTSTGVITKISHFKFIASYKRILGTSTNTFNDVLKMGSYINLDDNIIYLRNDTNHFVKYDSGINGMRLAGYGGGTYGSTNTSAFVKMFDWTPDNNIWYEANGDYMGYLVRNGITDLKFVIFRTPTSYFFTTHYQIRLEPSAIPEQKKI